MHLMEDRVALSPVWAAVFFAGALVAGYFAWAFRAGKAPYDGPRRVEGPMRLTLVSFGYMGVPAFIGLLAGAILAAFLSFDPAKTILNKSLGSVGLAVILISGFWMFKEFLHPTGSRTPEWLRREK